jgi:hypothetical protein
MLLVLFSISSMNVFAQEGTSGIFDFGDDNQILYHVSNGDIFLMSSNFATNTIHVDLYGTVPNEITLHIPTDVMNGEKFISYVTKRGEKISLDTKSIEYESLGITQVEIKLSLSRSPYEDQTKGSFHVTIENDEISQNLNSIATKLSSDSNLVKKFHHKDMGITLEFPDHMKVDGSDQNRIVIKSEKSPEVKYGKYFLTILEENDEIYELFLNQDVDKVKPYLQEFLLAKFPDLDGQIKITDIKTSTSFLGDLNSVDYTVDVEFTGTDIIMLFFFNITKVENSYLIETFDFVPGFGTHDAFSTYALIFKSLDVNEYVEKQISKSSDLKKEKIFDKNLGISLVKPVGWKHIEPQMEYSLMEFHIVDYFGTYFPIASIISIDDPKLNEIENHQEFYAYMRNLIVSAENSNFILSDIRLFEFEDYKQFTFVKETLDVYTGNVLFVEKSSLLVYDDGKMFEIWMIAAPKAFDQNVSDYDKMVRSFDCCSKNNIAFNEEERQISQPSQTNNNEGGGCLIATAAFGSEMAPQVQFLREIRDNTVMSTQSGTTFMNGFNQFYYSFSPYVADYERENPVFKEVVKVSLTPLLTSLTLLNYVDIDTEEEMLGYGIGIILLNIGMYFVAPAVLIVSLKKRLFL